GLLAWTQLVDPARHGRLRRSQRIFFALAMLAIAQPVVDLLLFSSAPRYARYATPADRLFGISPLTDQRPAGAVMLVEQRLTLGPCVALLRRPSLQARRVRARRPALSHPRRRLRRRHEDALALPARPSEMTSRNAVRLRAGS